MKIAVVTLFEELFVPFFQMGLIGRAVQNGLLQATTVNPRDHSTDKHRSVDDTPYGGGSGMVMRPEPLLAAIKHIEALGHNQSHSEPQESWHRVLLTPRGKVFRQSDAHRLALQQRVMFVCGRYEGIDERVHEAVDEEISIGDIVIMGGEAAAMCVIEAAVRLLPGVLGNPASLDEETHNGTLLEYPQYTRPAEYEGHSVPDVLQSGHHESIRKWRRLQQLVRTRRVRPDLFVRHVLTDEDRALLADFDKKE